MGPILTAQEGTWDISTTDSSTHLHDTTLQHSAISQFFPGDLVLAVIFTEHKSSSVRLMSDK